MTANKPVRPLPKIRSYLDTTQFWEGARQGKLMLQYCTATQRFQHYPRPVSIFNGRKNIEWRAASGKGTIYSWTVTRVAWPGSEERVPYICAYVDLEEEVRFLCNLVDCNADTLSIGMPVQVRWDRMSEEIAYPDFSPYPEKARPDR